MTPLRSVVWAVVAWYLLSRLWVPETWYGALWWLMAAAWIAGVGNLFFNYVWYGTAEPEREMTDDRV